MILPNFLIIGAAKAGTTSLAHYLKQHSQIYLSPIKEPFFFSLGGKQPSFNGPGDREAFHLAVTDLENYSSLFQGVEKELAIGEASTSYLYDPQAAKRIRELIPDVKLIAILRNPIDRAYASFLHQVRDGNEPLNDFNLALEQENWRINNDWMLLWHYKKVGFYYEQIKRYYDLFPLEQIKVYLFDDFQKDVASVLKNIFIFLEVEQSFIPDLSVRYNISGVPKSRLLNNFLSKQTFLKKVLKPIIPQPLRQNIRQQNLVKPHLSWALRQELKESYRDDILKLQALLDRDLSIWLK